MKEKNKPYRQDVGFINRNRELADLKLFIEKRPSEILFIHGPKSSGITTLLYKFLEKIQQEQKVDVKFMDLRKTFTNVYEDFLKAFFQVESSGEKKESRASNINIGFFKSMRRWKRKSWKNGPTRLKSWKPNSWTLPKKALNLS